MLLNSQSFLRKRIVFLFTHILLVARNKIWQPLKKYLLPFTDVFWWQVFLKLNFFQMVTLSSRAGSVYGSRPTSPHTRSMSGMGVGDNMGTLKSSKSQVNVVIKGTV